MTIRKFFFTNAVLIMFAVSVVAQAPIDPATPPADSGGASLPPPSEEGAGSAGAGGGTTAPAEIKITKPLGRQKVKHGVNSESSSFIGDPDNLDVLNAQKDSLKDGEEPVLEDIRQVLNAPSKKKKPKAARKSDPKKENPEISATDEVASETPSEAPPVTKSKKKSKKKKKTIDTANLNPDAPDLKLEKRLYQNYKKNNLNPTDESVWAEASSKQIVREYIVQKGDTLSSISGILFGDKSFWPKLWSLNRQGILNPHFINPKTTIYFFAGTDNFAPTLSLTPSGSLTPNEKNKLAHQVGGQDDPILIPDSLPLWRDTAYFAKPQVVGEVDVKFTPLVIPDYSFGLDYVLSEVDVKSRVGIEPSEVTRARCYPGRIVKEFRFVDRIEPEYDIYIQEPSIRIGLDREIFVYRYFGSAEKYNKQFIRIKQCNDLISKRLIFLPKGEIKKYRTSMITANDEATIIGGPSAVGQRFFAENQLAYIDFGTNPYEIGKEYDVLSRTSERISGRLKVIDKFGSYAVVAILTVNEDLVNGDIILVE